MAAFSNNRININHHNSPFLITRKGEEIFCLFSHNSGHFALIHVWQQ
ncbi:hypothetical protein PROSTU_03402 [Providencia stuartii ATCC 25827]|uniref:Uncharacterized protein n=1 Tax=Providencia stuartii ATCC 25827 TaxID=471874 RepID=A0AA87CRS5_PROST|nr:hypothetical protein PROSTU_03402 [Providencia stuartii ATCC 25827]